MANNSCGWVPSTRKVESRNLTCRACENMRSKGADMKRFATTVLLAGTSFATLAISASAAFADDAPPPPAWGTISAYVDVTSDYRFRGISQNDRQWAPQASVNWSGPDGFYLGVWASKTNWTAVPVFDEDTGLPLGVNAPGTPSFELDIYGGKHFDLDGMADLNIEAYYY